MVGWIRRLTALDRFREWRCGLLSAALCSRMEVRAASGDTIQTASLMCKLAERPAMDEPPVRGLSIDSATFSFYMERGE